MHLLCTDWDIGNPSVAGGATLSYNQLAGILLKQRVLHLKEWRSHSLTWQWKNHLQERISFGILHSIASECRLQEIF